MLVTVEGMVIDIFKPFSRSGFAVANISLQKQSMITSRPSGKTNSEIAVLGILKESSNTFKVEGSRTSFIADGPPYDAA